jgi:hypothetical protein
MPYRLIGFILACVVMASLASGGAQAAGQGEPVAAKSAAARTFTLVQAESAPKVDCAKARVCIPQCRIETAEKCKGDPRGGNCFPEKYWTCMAKPECDFDWNAGVEIGRVCGPI